MTTLSGELLDQAALMGVLNGLYGMGYAWCLVLIANLYNKKLLRAETSRHDVHPPQQVGKDHQKPPSQQQISGGIDMRRGTGPGRGRAGSQAGRETYDQAKDESGEDGGGGEGASWWAAWSCWRLGALPMAASRWSEKDADRD